MRFKLSIFAAVLLAMSGFYFPTNSHAQTVSLIPSAVPNGVAASSGQQYRQRMTITLGGSALNTINNMFTITAPAELTVVTNSVSATTGTAGTSISNLALSGGNTISVGVVTGTAGTAGNAIGNTQITVEFDVTTPLNFAGVGAGAKVDTSYSINFTSNVSQTNRTVAVAKHNDLPVRLISFVGPDSTQGDTTTAGGRFYKLRFSSAGLLDLSHTGLNRLTVGGGDIRTDATTDITYSFYLSTDSTLIKRPSSLARASFFTLQPTRTPLIGTRQNPRSVPNTFIREDYTSLFGSTGLDTLNGMVSLSGTADNTVYYVYVLADPNEGRLAVPSFAGGAKKGYDPTEQGSLTAGTFLGRSGPLLVQHPPEFVLAGWDYDDDSGSNGSDQFSLTGEIQIPSDQRRMGVGSARRKDNQNITVDSGGFFNKGAALSTLGGVPSGAQPAPITTADLLYVARDADNPNSFSMNIFLSTTSGLGVSNLVGTGIDSLAGAIKLANADTLKITQNVFTFNPIVRNTTTNLVDSFIPEGDYSVYFVATDGTYRTVYQVFDDPFSTSPSAATLSVKNSPVMNLDAFSLNDFSGDGDLDVVTGIGVSQMISDADGRNLSLEPSTRYVNLFWGGTSGLDGDLDVDDNATIDLYYSTNPSYRAAGKSLAYTSGNSDGTDLIAAQSLTTPDDTHLIVSGLTEDPDGLFDNNYQWDLWTYVSPEGTIPVTGVQYYFYALMRGGTTTRLVSLTEIDQTNAATTSARRMAVQFEHPPYIRGLEPAQDITVSVDEPVFVSWEAFDVDNGEASGLDAVPAGQSGRLAPNSRSESPNIRILLASSDWGEVTTWASIMNSTGNPNIPFWLANSNNGSVGSEIELNEGVDTSFVFTANRMRQDLTDGEVTTSASDLGTNGGVGVTYYVYYAIDDGARGNDSSVGNQPAEFTQRSPVVRAPGRITFTGTVPTNPITAPRFIVPKTISVVGNEIVKVPVLPDSLVGGQTVGNVSLFMSVDPAYWDAVDTDPNTAGTQPFTLGANSQLSAANVSQGVYTQNGKLRLDFIYDVPVGGTGLTFFDGKQSVAFLNLKAKTQSSGSTVNTEISIDGTEPRKSKLLVQTTNQDLAASIPAPISVDIVRRATMTGVVPLQGRTSSADTVTFMLREIGDLDEITDSLFALNDVNASKAGVQVVTTGVNGNFSLSNVPDGRWVLTATVQRFLTGHDTVTVRPGVDVSNVRPTLTGDGVDRASLRAGDAAGYTDSTGASVPDNTIDAQDTNAINAALFKLLGETGYNTFADVNGDSVVNATDKNFAAANTTDNTGASGIQPVFPSFKQVVAKGSNTEANVSLVGLPEGEVRVGETFDVTVQVNQAVNVRAYEVHLDFDAEKLAVEDMVSNGSLFEYYLQDMAGKMVDEGKIGLANAIIGQTPYGASGDASLATLRFRVVGRGGEALLKLSDAMLINVENLEAQPVVNADDMLVAVSNEAPIYHDADGNEIRGLILGSEDAKVDFNDFLVLAQGFGTSIDSEGFDFRADLNGDDTVNFADFIILTQDFNKVAVDAPAALRAGKVTPKAPGVNAAAHIGLKVEGTAKMGQDLVMDVTLADAQAVAGWGVTLGFDPLQYEFVEAIAPEGDLLSSVGGAPLFLVHHNTEGQVSLGNALQGVGSASASGDGVLARVILRPRGEFEDAQVELFDGVLFDPSRLENPVSALLDIQPVPVEFALGQNYPNPFNPETTISYDLAAGSEVRLEIYNVMGQLVRTLVSDHQVAGRYRVRWAGDDASGYQVASGVYFYRIQAADFHAVKKLMLLK